MRKLTMKGFSLIELMIVVAIIGILSAIAIPNFQRFQAKSRQAEVKADLAAIYTVEAAFKTEYQMYSGYFENLGYSPAGRYLYQHGFAGVAFPTAANLTAVGYAGPAGANVTLSAYCTANPTQCTFQTAPVNASGFVTNGVVTATAYTAYAAGCISSGTAACVTGNADKWSMNESRTLSNTQMGL